MLRAVCLLLVMCWVAACSGNAGERAPTADPDPVIRQALDGLMMTDMDLSARNEANAALTINYDHSLPPIADSRASIDAARQEAADLLGGGSAIEPLPGVKQVDVEMTFQPQWGMDMMSDEARLELGFM